MSKVSSMMTMGRQALMNNQNALQTVSHNIANKSTEGYSRQRVEFQTNDAVGFGKLRMGTGAHTSAIRRINNEFLGKQIQGETNKLGFSQSKADMMMRVEQIFNEQDNKGINRFASDFFNAFREFSNNPESLAARTLVKETATFASKDFGRVARQLKGIQSEIDQALVNNVDLINSYTSEIAQLNEKIQTMEVSGGVANDERDRRDLLVKNLAEKVNIRATEGEDGMVTITAGNTALLVSGIDSGKLKAAPSAEHGNKRDGNFDIFFQADPYASWTGVTQQFTGGEIGALIETRDTTINDIRDHVDEMAFTMTNKVNEVHSLGYTRKNTTGINFFKELDGARDAASKIEVNSAIYDDLSNIASAASPNAPGDNRVAIVISSLQNEQIMNGGTSTVDDFYNGLVGKLAIQTQKANGTHEHQKHIVDQLNNVRESISGVSLDEEATKMIEFQKAYDASAKMIKTADEMFQTVLEIKR